MDLRLRWALLLSAISAAIAAPCYASDDHLGRLLASVPLILAIGGPLGLMLLVPALRAHEHPIARALRVALPPLALVTVFVDTGLAFPGFGYFDGHYGRLHFIFWLPLYTVTVILAAAAIRRSTPREAMYSVLVVAGACLLVLVLDPYLLLLAVELAAVVLLARLEKRPMEHARAGIGAAVVFLAGLLSLVVLADLDLRSLATDATSMARLLTVASLGWVAGASMLVFSIFRPHLWP